MLLMHFLTFLTDFVFTYAFIVAISICSSIKIRTSVIDALNLCVGDRILAKYIEIEFPEVNIFPIVEFNLGYLLLTLGYTFFVFQT